VTKVKICGIQCVEVLQSMVHLPIAYIGFVFAKSRRQVTVEQAQKLVNAYKAEVLHSQQEAAKIVGVFVNPTLEFICDAVKYAQLDVVQLHGQESASFCAEVKDAVQVEIFKAFPAPTKGVDSPEQRFDAYLGLVDGVLLDTVLPGIEGGTGKTFDWSVLPDYINYAKNNNLPLLVAGGLQADNVDQLIMQYRPFGVDVSSGVETDGHKDIDKIRKFVERVNQA
jgi:phosphoribosylanthranilate isomerase